MGQSVHLRDRKVTTFFRVSTEHFPTGKGKGGVSHRPKEKKRAPTSEEGYLVVAYQMLGGKWGGKMKQGVDDGRGLWSFNEGRQNSCVARTEKKEKKKRRTGKI